MNYDFYFYLFLDSYDPPLRPDRVGEPLYGCPYVDGRRRLPKTGLNGNLFAYPSPRAARVLFRAIYGRMRGPIQSVGDAAPDFAVTDARGETLSSAGLRGRKVILIFLRHLGCPICRMELATLKRRQDELAERGAVAIVFVESADESVRAFAGRNDVRFHLVADPARKLYDLFGVGRGGLGAYFAPKAALSAIKATLSGHLHGRCEGSELQLPGDFVLDENGRLLYARRGKHIADNAPLDELLACLEGSAQV